MKILIATGIYPPDIGGPAMYAKNLKEEWEKTGHIVAVTFFGFEKKMPTGIRHIYYFFKIIPQIFSSDFILILDTFSVGLPAVIAAKIFNKKTILRVGGDFLWEQYVENHQVDITLNKFYEIKPKLSIKEKIIYFLTKIVFKNASAIVFSTDWQKEIFEKNYNLLKSKCFIIKNYYPEKKIEGRNSFKKNFLWAGRQIYLKNTNKLIKAFRKAKEINPLIELDLITGVDNKELADYLNQCYAVVLPSLSEVSPNFILEAISWNKTFILTKETGFYNEMKEFGIFVDPLDEEDIKNKILFLADENNYKLTKEKINNFNFTHSWKDVAEEFKSIFQKI